MKYLIIGGVAGGATVASRLRRMDEKAEIILFEREICFLRKLWITLLYRRHDQRPE